MKIVNAIIGCVLLALAILHVFIPKTPILSLIYFGGAVLALVSVRPHISFVWGKENVEFLRKRYEKLKDHHLFADMDYSEDTQTLTEWMPLVMGERADGEPVAATRVAYGADVDFGSLTRNMVASLEKQIFC